MQSNNVQKRLTSQGHDVLLIFPSLVDISIPDISVLTGGIVSIFCDRKLLLLWTDLLRGGVPHLVCNLIPALKSKTFP